MINKKEQSKKNKTVTCSLLLSCRVFQNLVIQYIILYIICVNSKCIS